MKNIFFKLLILSCLLSNGFAATVGIYTLTFDSLPEWDADSIHKGISGSEEAVIYLSESLVNLGYDVIVFGKPPLNSKYSETDSNPKYLPVSSYLDHKIDTAIACRNPFIGRYLKNVAEKVFLWPHDTPPNVIKDDHVKDFDEVIWLSEWQKDRWVAVNGNFQKFDNIYGNGLALEQFSQEKEELDNPYSCIYGSNYARGLEILLSIWPEVKEQFPQATLDIYYGWETWGLLSKDKKDKMKRQVEDLKNLDVKEHGMVSHKELNEAYLRSSLWTYPCIAPETYCITGIKAQYCGAIPVIIEGSALSETVRHGYKTKLREDYLNLLLEAMSNVENITLEERKQMQEFIHHEYTWDIIAQKLQANNL